MDVCLQKRWNIEIQCFGLYHFQVNMRKISSIWCHNVQFSEINTAMFTSTIKSNPEIIKKLDCDADVADICW